MVNFPSSLDALANPTATTKRNATGFLLHQQISDLNDISEALESELGAHTAALGALLGYTRRSDAAGAGLWVPETSQSLFNPIVNASLESWPEGATFTSIADSVYGPDGFVYGKSGAVVHDLLRSTDVPAVAYNAPLGNYSLHLDVTTADASIAAGDTCIISTRIEGFDFLPFAQQAFVLSFWVKAAKTGVHCVAFRNSAPDRSYIGTYTVNAADTWEFKTIPVLASPSAGTWDYTTGIGLSIAWVQSCGSTYQTTAGAWQTGNFLASSAQVNETDSAANNFKIFAPKLTLGTAAGIFHKLPRALNDLRCKRYYRLYGGEQTVETFGTGFASSTTLALCSMPLTPPMRAVPTVSVSAASDLGVQRQGGALVTCTAIAVDTQTSTQVALIRATVAAGLTAGEGCHLLANTTANARLKLSARL